MTATGIARTLVSAAARHRSMECRIGGWAVSLDLWLANWTFGLWIDAGPVVQLWLGPSGLGAAKISPGGDTDDRRWDHAWTLGRITVGRTEFRLEADLNIWQIGASFARGFRDVGLYFGSALNVQIEHDVCWHDPRPNPVLRLLVPKGAPKWSILSRQERAAALEQAMEGCLDFVRFGPAATGLNRPLWIGQGVEVVVLPGRPDDQATIDRDCAAVGLDQDSGYRDADRWLEVNAYPLRRLSAGLIDEQDFLILSRRLGRAAHDPRE